MVIMEDIREQDIAIIGISLRFPGAKNHKIFWDNLCCNVESIIFSNVQNNHTVDENYVNAAALLEDIDLFDAKFFGYNKKVAELMDPQHRIFLECVHECFEDSGYNSALIGARTSVFAGASISSYLINNLNPIYNPHSNQNFFTSLHNLRMMIGNDKDYLPTKASYKFNLKGPSINVQTACSTSLVAIHLACNSLLNNECDFAVAGASNIQIPQGDGYLYEEGMMLSPDGHCRAFDVDAQGTIFGNGVGVVLLKSAKKAIESRDNIYAIIKSTALNNDGGDKMTYTAPSAEGQTLVVQQALSKSGLSAENISFVEAHGTATSIGDPIEVTALTKAFSTQKKQYCALGSVKTNIGHLGWAAGIAGLIKVALALKYKKIPATLHFKNPNQLISIDNTPFFVNSKLIEWDYHNGTRYAAVSAFGVGGTNAHIIVSEYDKVGNKYSERHCDNYKAIFLISAKTEKALEDYCLLFSHYLESNNKVHLLDLCFTVNESRSSHCIRKVFKIDSVYELSEQLLYFVQSTPESRNYVKVTDPKKITFLFGAHFFCLYNFGTKLYKQKKIFKKIFDECAQVFLSLTNEHLKDLLFTSCSHYKTATYRQSLLFILEISIAQMWIALNIKPHYVLGYGFGALSAACTAGILTIKEALKILIEFDISADAVINQRITVQALINTGSLRTILQEKNISDIEIEIIQDSQNKVVLSTTREVLDILKIQGVRIQYANLNIRQHTNEKYMSKVDSILSEIIFKQPQVKFINSHTGQIMTQGVFNKEYLKDCLITHSMSDTVLQTLKDLGANTYFEITPQNVEDNPFNTYYTNKDSIFSTMHSHRDEIDQLFNNIAKVSEQGMNVNWEAWFLSTTNHRISRISLPTYPFQRERFWLEKNE